MKSTGASFGASLYEFCAIETAACMHSSGRTYCTPERGRGGGESRPYSDTHLKK